MPRWTATYWLLDPVTTWTPYPPSASATSASTGADSTSFACADVNVTLTGAPSSAPNARWSDTAIVTWTVVDEEPSLLLLSLDAAVATLPTFVTVPRTVELSGNVIVAWTPL